MLGIMYRDGDGVQANIQEARRLLGRAASLERQAGAEE
jgi:TPR repeat protein